MFPTPGSLPRIPGRAKPMPGSYLGSNVYTSTQTVVIPKWARWGAVRMCGGGGGAKTGNVTAGISAAAAGAYLEKLLTGLTAGLTLALTIGAGGAATPANGGNSTLASGTQVISTLTCPGGGLANGGAGITLGSCSVATGGDFNIPGGSGTGGAVTDLTDSTAFSSGSGGSNPMGFASSSAGAGAAGNNYGSGASAGPNSSAAGAPAACIIDWYA